MEDGRRRVSTARSQADTKRGPRSRQRRRSQGPGHPLRPPALLALLVLAAASVCDAQRFPACGVRDDRWSVEDPAEDFFILAAEEGEARAAEWYRTGAATGGSEAADLLRQAAMASERAIADLAAAAIILENNRELRSARNVRALKERHRLAAESSWDEVERLGGVVQRGAVERPYACSPQPGIESALARAQGERHLARAERALSGVEPPYPPERLRERAAMVAGGADALVAAGCADGDHGLEDLLEASFCYLAVAPDAGPPERPGDLYARAAAALRSIAHRRSPARR
jgi:hypothetical protein